MSPWLGHSYSINSGKYRHSAPECHCRRTNSQAVISFIVTRVKIMVSGSRNGWNIHKNRDSWGWNCLPYRCCSMCHCMVCSWGFWPAVRRAARLEQRWWLSARITKSRNSWWIQDGNNRGEILWHLWCRLHRKSWNQKPSLYWHFFPAGRIYAWMVRLHREMHYPVLIMYKILDWRENLVKGVQDWRRLVVVSQLNATDGEHGTSQVDHIQVRDDQEYGVLWDYIP